MRIVLPFKRLRKTLAFRFLIVSVLAIAAIVPIRMLEVQGLRQQAIETGNAAVSRIATNGIARLSDIIDESKTILTITALLPTFAVAGVPDCHSILTPIVAETAWMNSLSAVAADGTITCSSSSIAEHLPVGDRPYLQEALRLGQFVLSGVVVSRVTKAPTLFATMPVAAKGGTAALLMAINASWFTNIAQDVGHSAPGGIAMIVGRDGNVIGRSDGASEQDGASLQPRLADLLHLDHDGAKPMTLANGEVLVVAVREIPRSQALLVIGIPQAELHRHALAIQTNVFGDLAVALGVIILIFWLGHESFIRPVVALAAAARRLGRGKFDIKIDASQWASEFQTLADAITSASSNLASRAQADAAVKASLRAQSLEDPLTGLKNRRGLDQFVELEWQACARKGIPFAALAFDVDFFKQYNDCYGHDAGDQALRAVGLIMRTQADHAGGFAARTGGEEFTIVMPGMVAEDAKAIADAVSLRVTALRIPHVRSPLGTLTISAGISAAVPEASLASSDVFRAADNALYGAKEAGRNTITVGSVGTAPRPRREVDDSAGIRAESSGDKGNRRATASPLATSR